MLQYHFYLLLCLCTKAVMFLHYGRATDNTLKNGCTVITDFCCYQQKSMKMKTTRFHFLFLVRMSSKAVAVGMQKRQG